MRLPGAHAAARTGRLRWPGGWDDARPGKPILSRAALPAPIITKPQASRPSRSVKDAQPLCGSTVTTNAARPIAKRGPRHDRVGPALLLRGRQDHGQPRGKTGKASERGGIDGRLRHVPRPANPVRPGNANAPR